MAVSPAVCDHRQRDSGKISDMPSIDLYKKTVGQRPETEIMIQGISVNCLVDTGSQVSTISESFYKDKLQSHVQLQEGKWFPLSAANGLEIPYLGVTLVDVEVFGTCVKQVGFLVVKDNPLVQASKIKEPGILGTNVLKYLSTWNSLFDSQGISIQSHSAGPSESSISVVRVAGREDIIIPAHSVVNVPVHTNYSGCEACLIEPLVTPIKGNLTVLPSLVNFSKSTPVVQVVNMESRDVWLKPGFRIALRHSIEEIVSNHQVVNLNTSFREIQVETVKLATVEILDGSRDNSFPDIDLSNFQGSEQVLECVRELLNKYSDIFMKKNEPLGCTKTVKHTITTTDNVPVSQPYRRIPPGMIEEVRNHLNELLKKGVIQESTSEYAAPIVLVRKKNGELRMCVDYRALNKKVVRDVFPLPRIEESLEALGKAHYFSTLDLASAYNQVEVDPLDRPKTAFTTQFGLFEHVRMPFGISNAPSTFQRLMTKIFREDILRILIVYLDDIVIYSETLEEHLQSLDLVFGKLKEHGLKLKAEKCELFKTEVKYLGHILSNEGLKADPSKTIAVEKWSRPCTLQELRRFLGFTSYYRRFVPNFAKLAAPLHSLVGTIANQTKRKKATISSLWSEEHENAFQALKQKLVSPPVLAYPDFSKGFMLETDASAQGFGAILSQMQDGKQRVIAYASRGLRENERKMHDFSAMKLELLAMVWAIGEKFREYLHICPFTVITDNNPLSYFMTKAKLTATEQKWAATLATFDFTIKYRSGKHNVGADALSRQEERSWEISEICTHGLESSMIPSELQCFIMEEIDCARVKPVVSEHLSTSLPVLDLKDVARLQDEDSVVGTIKKMIKENKKKVFQYYEEYVPRG